jgi:hypothetical protein
MYKLIYKNCKMANIWAGKLRDKALQIIAYHGKI